MNFLGNELDVLRGQIGGHEVTALPDTGAESNIMDFGYKSLYYWHIASSMFHEAMRILRSLPSIPC